MRTGYKTSLMLALLAMLALGIIGCGSGVEPCSASVEEHGGEPCLKECWECEKWPSQPALSGNVNLRLLRSEPFADLGRVGARKTRGTKIDFNIYDRTYGMCIGSVSIQSGRSFAAACAALVDRCASHTADWPGAMKYANGNANLRAGDIALVLPKDDPSSNPTPANIKRVIFIRNNISVGISASEKSSNFDIIEAARVIDSKLVDLLRQS
ncbi:MAG: hypothetical protein JXA52_06330 [Planctomycetes bacterium]|nr:hypothetical protein [Planctomycetota bacterium]